MTADDVVKWLQWQAEWLLVGSVLALNHALAHIVHVGRRQELSYDDCTTLYVPLRDRITTTNSTEVRLKFGRIAQRCRAKSSRIIRQNRTSAHLYLVNSGMKSEAGHFIVETVEMRAAFAASSACSLPQIPVWPGIQIRVIVSGIDQLTVIYDEYIYEYICSF